MAARLDWFEDMLAQHDYLLGAFSAADWPAFPFLKYALWRQPADVELFHRILELYQPFDDKHPHLAAWIARVEARPRAR